MTQTNKADVVIFLTTILAAIGWIFTKMGTTGMSPQLFLGLRFTGAGLVVLLFCDRQLMALSLRQFILAAQTGLIQAIGLAIWVTAISQSSRLSEGVFITSTLVIMVPFIGRLFFKTKISKEVFIALPLAGFDLSLLALDTNWQFEPAQILFLLSALFFSLHINLLSHFGKEVPAMPMTAIQLLMVGLVGLAGFTLFEPMPESINNDIWWWLAVSILIATSLRFFLQT